MQIEIPNIDIGMPTNFLQVMLLIALLCLYLLPTVIAALRSHDNTGPIFIINLLLGWSFVGWVVALAWSFTALYRDEDNRTYII